LESAYRQKNLKYATASMGILNLLPKHTVRSKSVSIAWSSYRVTLNGKARVFTGYSEWEEVLESPKLLYLY